MPRGFALDVGVAHSVMTPAVVTRAILLVLDRVTQRLPSGPVVMCAGPL